MKYTKKLPTESGWYFVSYEYEEKCGLRSMTTDVIFFCDDGGMIFLGDDDDKCQPLPIKTILRDQGIDMEGKDIFFAGPIETPEESREMEKIMERQYRYNEKLLEARRSLKHEMDN